MGSQRFCLRWNNHQSNLLSVFDQLLHDEAFVDVTLAVEGQFLKAHKMVLSACSPYFQALFVGHPDKHPIVILKDVPYTDMRSLLDFMYRGEVSVDQDRLTAFLKVAESLRIKGLTEVNEERCDLPTIANSLLSQTLLPPPPPSLHRIQVPPPPQAAPNSHQTHPHMQSLNKRPHPHHFPHNLMLNSALTAPKRKRGRPRKLSGGSPSNNSANCDAETDEPKVNNVDNHLPVVLAEHLVVKPVAPSSALPKQLTVLNAANPPPNLNSPQSGDRCSPHREMSPTTVPRVKGDNSEPHSPQGYEGMKSEDNDDIDDGTEADGEGEGDNPSPDTENETDDYNHVKMEGEPKPSTSGQENSSPYQQQSQQPNQQNSQPTTNSTSESQGHHYSTPVMDSLLRLGHRGEIPSDVDSDDDDEESLIVDGYMDGDRDVENNNDTSGNNEDKPPTPENRPPLNVEFTEPSRPAPQRRRVRRRTTSSTDPAEALTEMSVRGLNLFRYASISEGVYKCMECAKADVLKTFKNKYSFQRHAFLYHEGHQRKVFPCPVCSKEFSRPDKMKNHMKMVHDCFMPKEVMFPSVGFYLPPYASSSNTPPPLPPLQEVSGMPSQP